MLAWPKTLLEAFHMLGIARERGVHAFWSEKPSEGGYMAWTGLDGQRLNVSAGERRCVLVSTVDTDIHGHMYAGLMPCHMRLADGVVCESAQSARKHVTRLNPNLTPCVAAHLLLLCAQLHRPRAPRRTTRHRRRHRRPSP